MKYIFVSLFLALSTFAAAQSVSEKMGTIPTNLRFFSNEQQLEVSKQLLSHRIPGDGRAGESWFLEFVSMSELRTVRPTAGEKAHVNCYKVVCMDSKKNVLFTVYVPAGQMREWSNDEFWTYAMDLRSFPYVLLDNVSIIDILFIGE